MGKRSFIAKPNQKQYLGSVFWMLVTQNVKLGKEDLCDKLKPPSEELHLSGGMLTLKTKSSMRKNLSPHTAFFKLYIKEEYLKTTQLDFFTDIL
ncbi:hypothetical protein [Solibacillus sp. FSL K6-1523]|uniref:hypothetical protein n=1 Tax=Solibacillus sp. FSL K6-1523 TaxID=2921471 RepID=UPI0030F9393D